ncbi:MAG: ABC transporter ATP-binding protein [Lentimicrobiaceae bacterium]|nr:ABC transporter ATP-binding protein [Lentimicrobiaceae bacterium]
MEVLKTKDLLIGYKDNVILPPINVSLNSGDLIALIGPNGAGKSTLFKTLTANIKPIGGSIKLYNRELSSYTSKEKSTMIGLVLTERPDDMFLKVYDVVASGRSPYTDFFGRITDEDNNIIKESLEIVNIIHLKDRYFNALSDGEKQKVMIAKTIAQKTPIIFMDEPTAFIDYPSKIELFSIMRKLSKERNTTIIFSSHDLELLLRYTDDIWMISKGKELLSFKKEELLKSEKIREYFNLNESLVFFDERIY